MPDRRGTSPDQALLVGVSTYEYHVERNEYFGLPGDIPAARHNVERMKSTLQGMGLFPDSALRVCDDTCSEEQVLAELKATSKLARGLLLFYFCGHAMPHLRGEELWLPLHRGHAVRGEDSTDYANSLRLTRVLERLGRSPAQRIVVVLDCCYAGTAEALLGQLPESRRRKFTLLLGVQSNRRVDAGDGEDATPYTRELTELLSAGHHDLRDLAQRLAATAAAQGWKTYEGSVRETVHVAGDPMAQVRLEPTAAAPENRVRPLVRGRGRGRAAPRQRERTTPLPGGLGDRLRGALLRPAARLVTACVLLALLGAGVGAWLWLTGDGQAHACVPPQEIRLLTDPELEEAVRAAADAFEATAAANKDAHGCLRGGITVYSAPADRVAKAFREDAAAWQDPTQAANPARDIGPQPDVWIPATSAEVPRARPAGGGAGPAELSDHPTALPVSPMVLAVPAAVADRAGLSAGRTGRPLDDLLADVLAAEPGSAVRRTDPEVGTAGLLATQGLYAGLDGVADRKRAERRTTDGLRVPVSTGEHLLCEAPHGGPGATDTLLLPAFRLKDDPDCGRPDTVRRIAVQPDDVPGLDPVFVRVRWAHASGGFTSVRQETLEAFETWLTGPEGRKQFILRGFDSGGISRASTEDLNTTLAQYRQATGPGRVLFLVDSSGSMADRWEGDGGALGLLKAAFEGLGTEDEYAVWGVASADGADRPYSTVLPMDGHRPDTARATLGSKAALHPDLEADPYRALGQAVDTLAARGRDDDRPQLVVLLTDDEDSRRPGWQRQLDDLTDRTRDKGVPIVMAVMESGACAAGAPARRVADTAGGRCLDAPGTLVRDLAAEVAWVGKGEAR
ncbi:VWA domain-containing protein [Streptomyces ficellus]|uniref:VWA domain-containing protein n=1 Tax=Streptomyces ficellus TaxID=1977088 RepID=A0A6I6FID7_9ACTN|nr:VWA domain-containing protein [Streptomyces ficellus]QGV77248.1 VWA domain-containing protein [Streptomyces ficellus]